MNIGVGELFGRPKKHEKQAESGLGISKSAENWSEWSKITLSVILDGLFNIFPIYLLSYDRKTFPIWFSGFLP